MLSAPVGLRMFISSTVRSLSLPSSLVRIGLRSFSCTAGVRGLYHSIKAWSVTRIDFGAPPESTGMLLHIQPSRPRLRVLDSRFPSMSSTYASPLVFGFGMLTATFPCRFMLEGLVVWTPGIRFAKPVIQEGRRVTTEARSPTMERAGSSPSLGFSSCAPRLSYSMLEVTLRSALGLYEVEKPIRVRWTWDTPGAKE